MLMMKYEFVTRSIPTLWKGCYLLLARALAPVVFMAQPLRSVRCFLAHRQVTMPVDRTRLCSNIKWHTFCHSVV